MLGWFTVAAAMRTWHLGSFKSISPLQVPKNVICEAHSLHEHPLCRVPLHVISIGKT